MTELSPGLLLSLGVACAGLLIGSCVRLIILHGDASAMAVVRRQSLIVWWVLLLSLGVALVCGRIGLSVLFCSVGVIALVEFHLMFARCSNAPKLLFWVVAALGVGHYLLLVTTNSLWPLTFFPLLALITISAVRIFVGETADYLRAAAGYLWAGLLLFWGVSHGVALLQLPVQEFNGNREWTVGAAGWPLLVVLLTEIDDIFQALIGRRWGRHKMIPRISPGKSWEGFLGGLLATTTLSVAVTPWLTSLAAGRTAGLCLLISISVGLLVSVTGFLGDVNISALKREAGVKDSGSLLPGMGGMMDRIDSLSFSAPAFYYMALAMTHQ